MSLHFHGKECLDLNTFLQILPDVDLDRIALGLHYFPETGLADFFACHSSELISLSTPLELLKLRGHSGFVAFPFQPGAKGYFIPAILDAESCTSNRFVVEGLFREKETHPESELHSLDTGTAEDYTESVKDALQAINEGKFEKVVLSRKIKLPFKKELLAPFIGRLFEKYPKANLMIFNIPGKGCWISASPEVLLAFGYSIMGAPHSSIISHALAGTMAAESEQPWAEKEIREQALVGKYIEEKFRELIPAEAIQKWGPGEQLAGNLKHLASFFHVQGGNADLAIMLAESLHPTPAVCGFPYEPAFGWLIEREKLDRSFFSGFSGSFHPERMKFIVNLRTACYRDDNLIFFAGAGIVKDSDPEAELAETESKIDTLRSLIDAQGIL